ncbi:hypothetical protein [Streptomyces otsuchiensis]|uniref:hypothetical protein n=1 Tax=Streptomyces otsuchiensis TaxID=2681388 RepID=UPI00103061C1|nr:hypothetical protein [Streptomyces otsuchiensis]
MRGTRGTGVRSVAVAAAAVLALSACGSDSSDGEASEPATEQGQEEPEGQQETPEGENTDEGSESDASEEWVSGSPLTGISVEEGEDSDTVILEFANAAPDYLGDGYVDRVARGGDRSEESYDVDGDVYLFLRLMEQSAFESGEMEEIQEVRTDGRVAHVFPHGQFEGEKNVAIGIESENGEEPGYDITTEESTIVIEISADSR